VAVSEHVLVVPTAVLREAGIFHGFTNRIDPYLAHLLKAQHLLYLPRDEAELDPNFKQLIPYVVLRNEGRVFHYTRRGGGEKRLHARRSIGIGGHISSEDGAVSPEVYRTGMMRELAEEVALEGDYREKCIGLINDDRTPVGQVHLGIVHVFDLASPSVRSREDNLLAGGFSTVQELRGQFDQFETWSQFLLEGAWLA
jgi:predicted NUDIX family phosphoesterase